MKKKKVVRRKACRRPASRGYVLINTATVEIVGGSYCETLDEVKEHGGLTVEEGSAMAEDLMICELTPVSRGYVAGVEWRDYVEEADGD